MRIFETIDVRKFEDESFLSEALTNASNFRKKKYEAINNHLGKLQVIANTYLLDKCLKELGLLERDMEYIVEKNGKLRFANKPDVHFNLSHSKNMSLAVVSDEPVGCDIQFIDKVDEKLYDLVLSEEEKKYVVGASVNSVGASSTSPEPVGASSTSPLKDSMSVNPHADIYGDMKAEFIDFGILDQKGNPATVIVKGETFTIKEKIRMNEDIKDPIFTWTIKDKRGTDLTGTNTMLEKVDTGFGEKGRVYDVSFTQKMRLQGGEYLLSMSCTSFEGDELKVHHRMYDVISLTVLINENKVGIFDSESKVDIH